MKFTFIGHSTFAWAELLKEFPPEHVRALNSSRINVQSLSSFLRLITAFDTGEDLNKIQPPLYILELASMSFWFELPFTLIEELLTKSRIKGVNVQQARTDLNQGILVGTVGAWIELCNYRGSAVISTELTNLCRLVIETLERESLTFLLHKQ